MRIIWLIAWISIFGLMAACLVPCQEASAQVQITLKKSVVRPGETQTVSLHGIGSTPYQVRVTMPDGETLAPAQGSEAALSGIWSFVQPPNTITHSSRRATVSVTVGDQTVQTHYTVGFAPIDLVAPHGLIADYSVVTIWVHARPKTNVRLQSSWDGSLFNLLTGPRGWTQKTYQFENPTIGPPFDPNPATIIASATVNGRRVSTRADFLVRQFQFQVSLQNLTLLHQVGTGWVATSTVRVGEQIEIRGDPFITEPAGVMPYCVSATVNLVQDNQVLQMAPMECAGQAPPEMTGDLTIGPGAVPGPVNIGVDASFENGTFHTSIPITVSG